MNGYNFTERMRKVLAMAREESARLRHEYVGTEHILLALIRDDEGVASAVLHNLSIDGAQVRARIEAIVREGRSKATGPDLPYTSRAKKTLELAMSEARELDHSYVGTEHLLLGLLREEKGIAAQVLMESGLTLVAARAETLRVLGSEMPAEAVGGARRREIRLRSVPAESPRSPTRPPWPVGAPSLDAAHVRRVEAEAEKLELETDWMHVQNVIALGVSTGTPVRLEPTPDGVLWLVLGDNFLRVRVPGSTLPPASPSAGEGRE